MNTENLGIGLQLMIVGMATVFVILLIVINLGKLLIAAVNKWAPEEEVAPKKQAAAQKAIDTTTMAIINETVKTITGGKGCATNIKKI